MVLATTVSQVLSEKKSHKILSITPERSVFEALEEMARGNVGALLVLEDGRIVGIFSERDYARKVALSGRDSRLTKISEVMQPNVICVTPDELVEGCLRLMTERRIRHLPVLDQGKLVGLVSIGDVVKSVISDQEFMIDQLTHYVHGSYAGWFDQFGPGRAEASTIQL